MRIFTLVIIIFFSFLQSSYSQCSGNVHIDSQEQLNKFECKDWDGNLLISDKSITKLDPLQSLLTITGNLIISDMEGLESLWGIHNLTSIGGNLQVENLPSLGTFGNVQYKLEDVGNSFRVIDCPKLVNNDNLVNVVVIKGDLTLENVGSMNGFPSLKACPWIRMRNLGTEVISGFSNMSQVRILNIESCSNLVQIDGFNNLTSVKNYDSGPQSFFQIKNNTKLKDIGGFESLDGVSNLSITGNSNLSECCDLLPSMLTTSGTISISSNDSGCSSQNQINAGPTLSGCPGNETVSTASNSCVVSYSLKQPAPSDNCDLTSTNIRLTLADGSIPVSESISPGATNSYSLQKGINVFRFLANDGAGNQEICNATITVEDDVKPTLTNCPSDVTIDTDSNIQCSGGHSYSVPNANDNCALSSFKEKIIAPGGSVVSDIIVNSGQGFTKTFGIGTSTLEYTAVDAEGNQQVCSVSITVEDSKPPVLNGIPSSVTISCNESFPTIPSPTASDICSGNLTNAITVSSSTSMGACEPGQVAETQEYTWTVTDNAGNSNSSTWSVTVVSDFEFDLGENLSLCGANAVTIDAGNIGDSYLWSTGATSNNISVSSSGTYSLTVTTINGCCYSDEVTVEIGDNPTASAQGGTLSCTAGSISLSGSSTTPGVTYSWSGPGGFSSTQMNPEVTSIGTYTLTVSTSNGCTATAEATVLADTDVPNVSASGGELSCSVSQTQIFANSTTSGVSYKWSGPGGFSSSNKSPMVSLPGIYTVTVTADNGCSSSASAEVSSDDAGPILDLEVGMLNCNILETTIFVDASSDAESFSWSGPSGFFSDDKEPEVSDLGTYTLTATSENGCTSTANIQVGGDYSAPNATAEGGKISCSDNETMINGSTTTPNASYSWSGPNGFVSSLQNPFISQPGTYTLTVIGQNGCTASAEAVVTGDGEIPTVTANGGTIDCINETVTIVGTVDDPTATTSWSGPNGFATTSLSSVVDIPGVYTFTVTTPGGCQSFVSVEVVLDNSEPNFTIGEGFIDCEGGVRDFLLVTSTEDATYLWSGPNGYESTAKQPTYSEAGTYGVTITGGNGCVANGGIVVEHDVPYTFEITTTNGVTTIDVFGGTPPFTFLWNDKDEGTSINNLSMGDNFIRIIDGLECESIEFFDLNSSVVDIAQVDGLNVYPNPTSDFLTIDVAKTLEISRLELIDQKGALILSDGLKSELNVSYLPQGIYFLRLISKDVTYFYKFIKI
jgi:hypothetical protein